MNRLLAHQARTSGMRKDDHDADTFFRKVVHAGLAEKPKNWKPNKEVKIIIPKDLGLPKALVAMLSDYEKLHPVSVPFAQHSPERFPPLTNKMGTDVKLQKRLVQNDHFALGTRQTSFTYKYKNVTKYLTGRDVWDPLGFEKTQKWQQLKTQMEQRYEDIANQKEPNKDKIMKRNVKRKELLRKKEELDRNRVEPNLYSYAPKIEIETQISDTPAPFGSGIPRFKKQLVVEASPAPGQYSVTHLQVGRRIDLHGVFAPQCEDKFPNFKLKCPPVRKSEKCDKCQVVLGRALNILWFYSKALRKNLCKTCYNEENQLPQLFTAQELKNFTRVRSCSFIHKHFPETSTPQQLCSPTALNKLKRREMYLRLFME